MSKTALTKLTSLTETAESAESHQARFIHLHRIAQARGLEFKIAAYFAGLELQGLHDTFTAQHGETRGRPAKGAAPALSWEDYVEHVTGTAYRTAARYRAQYQALVSEHADIARKLNAHWQGITSGGAKRLTECGGGITAPTLTAKALQALCEHADAWGLNELFAKPEPRDVTPEETASAAKRGGLGKFWVVELGRRIKSREFLRLPRHQLEAFAAMADEAAKMARDAAAAKKGGRK